MKTCQGKLNWLGKKKDSKTNEQTKKLKTKNPDKSVGHKKFEMIKFESRHLQKNLSLTV